MFKITWLENSDPDSDKFWMPRASEVAQSELLQLHKEKCTLGKEPLWAKQSESFMPSDQQEVRLGEQEKASGAVTTTV